MLCEAQGLVKEQDLVLPGQLTEWDTDPKFTDTCSTPERIQIDGHVDGGDGKIRAKQAAFLKRKKLPLASLQDLAAAFVANYIATGEPLFGWYDKPSHTSFLVRAAGGALYFNSSGLSVYVISDGYGGSYMAVASRVPRIKN